MTLDQGVATTGAAILAAIASLVSLVLTIRAGRQSEMRVAHRARIDIYLTELSEDIHTVIAGITIIRKRVAIGSDTSQWQATAKSAGNRIDIIRRRTRYVFEGFDESLRQMALASDHIATYKDLPNTNVEDLLKAYKVVSDQLNKALARQYRRGMPSGWFTCWRLSRACKSVSAAWEVRPSK